MSDATNKSPQKQSVPYPHLYPYPPQQFQHAAYFHQLEQWPCSYPHRFARSRLPLCFADCECGASYDRDVHQAEPSAGDPLARLAELVERRQQAMLDNIDAGFRRIEATTDRGFEAMRTHFDASFQRIEAMEARIDARLMESKADVRAAIEPIAVAVAQKRMLDEPSSLMLSDTDIMDADEEEEEEEEEGYPHSHPSPAPATGGNAQEAGDDRSLRGSEADRGDEGGSTETADALLQHSDSDADEGSSVDSLRRLKRRHVASDDGDDGNGDGNRDRDGDGDGDGCCASSNADGGKGKEKKRPSKRVRHQEVKKRPWLVAKIPRLGAVRHIDGNYSLFDVIRLVDHAVHAHFSSIGPFNERGFDKHCIALVHSRDRCGEKIIADSFTKDKFGDALSIAACIVAKREGTTARYGLRDADVPAYQAICDRALDAWCEHFQLDIDAVAGAAGGLSRVKNVRTLKRRLALGVAYWAT
jgi:hypothetical protein